jgi:hypothetical protein
VLLASTLPYDVLSLTFLLACSTMLNLMQVQRQAVEYAGAHNASPINPYGAYRSAAPVAKRRKVPKNYVEMGRMNYISLTQGSVLHPFGQDDWISR